MTLSLADIASRVHLPTPRDAEQLIVRMVEKGEIQATIDQSHGMVNFRESPESYASLQATQMIDRKIKSSVPSLPRTRARWWTTCKHCSHEDGEVGKMRKKPWSGFVWRFLPATRRAMRVKRNTK